MLGLVLSSFAGALAVMLVAWLLSRRLGRIDIVDTFWGLAFVGALVGMRLYHPQSSLLVWAADALVVVWALRLSTHIYRRFRRSQQQDERYTQLMQKWPEGNRSLQTLGRIFLVQAGLATVVILPVITLHRYGVETPAFAAGITVWLLGFTWESVADKQLTAFVRQAANKGKLMIKGLWQYSRHPNYFGEMAMWWGLAIMTLGRSVWWLALIGAATITGLIMFVSGVPLAEARMARKAGWEQYAAHTNKVLPWFPAQKKWGGNKQ